MTLLAQAAPFAWSNQNSANGKATFPGVALGPAMTAAASGDLAGATAVQVLTSAEMANEAYGLHVGLLLAAGASAERSYIWDIGIDPAGGTSYTWLFGASAPMVAWPGAQTSPQTVSYPSFYIPVAIPKNASVGIRVATSHSSTTSCRAFAIPYGVPSRPELVPTVSMLRSQALGFTATTYGTALPCAADPNGRTWGAWTSLGTTSFPWRYAFISAQLSTASASVDAYNIEVGYGNGSSEMTVILPQYYLYLNGSEYCGSMCHTPPGWCDVPSGATLYARCQGGATNPLNQTNGPASGPALNVTVAGFG